jgi:RNA polymerase sigma-70 factor (ECF subfamily)
MECSRKEIISEEDLVTGCKRRDNVSRRYLYNAYAKTMMGICYRYTGDVPVAEDLLHDGFIRIFESIHTFQYRGTGSLRAWMSRIFANLALEYLRKNSWKESISLEDWQETDDLIDETDLEIIPTDVLMGFVAELPVGYRTIFNLNTFEELSHKEIAQLMHINESSSRSQLSRARTILTTKVKAYICQYG